MYSVTNLLVQIPCNGRYIYAYFEVDTVNFIFQCPFILQMCSKVLQPTSLVVVFETLLSSAAITIDEEKGNPSWQACADFYVICILSCLPWGGAELAEVRPFLALNKRCLVGLGGWIIVC